MYENAGCSWNEPISPYTLEHIKNCYDTSTWTLRGLGVRLDTACNTSCRAPGKFHEMWGTVHKLDASFNMCIYFCDDCDIY